MLKDKTNRKLISFLNFQLLYNVFFICIQLGILSYEIYIVYAVINLLIFFRLLSFISLDLRKYSRFVSVILIIYLAYSVYLVTNFSGSYSIQNVLRYAVIPSGFMFYFAPLFVVQFSNKDNFPTILTFIYKQSMIYIALLCIFMFYDITQNVSFDKVLNHFESLQLYLGGGLIFLVFFVDLLGKFQRKFVWIAVFVTVLVAAIFARRAILATYVLGIALYFMGKTISTGSLLKKIQYLIVFGILFTIVAYVLIVYGENLFPTLFDRIKDDTRSGVELEVLYILEKSGKYLTGLGINGSYYSDYVGEMRDGCETGYLNMIMKGGYIYIFLFYLLFLPALIKTIFMRNKDKIIIMCFLYSLLVIIVGNVASSTFTFSIRYITFVYIMFYLYNKKIA